MQEEGYVAALLYPEGAKDVELGKVVAIIVEDKADLDAFKNYTAESASAPAAAPAEPAGQAATPAAAAVSSSPAAAPTQSSGDRVFVSPLAKRMAEEKGLSLDSIKGTGPNNRIIAADVEEAKSQPASAPAKAPAAAAKPAELPSTAAAYEDFENSQIRKVIAERLTYSKQNIPHYYVTV